MKYAKSLYECAPGELVHTWTCSIRGRAFSTPSATILPPPWDIMSSNNLTCTPMKSGLKNRWLSLLLQINGKMTFVDRILLSRTDRDRQTPAQNCTLTSIDFRQSISSWTKGSNISKTHSSEEFTLDLFRLMCRSWCRKHRTFISKAGWDSNKSSKVPHCFRL